MAPLTSAPSKALSDNASFRETLRRTRLAARLALSPEAHRDLSQQIERHLAELLHQHPFRVLGCYWPIRAEFDCRPLVTRLIAAAPDGTERQACLPVVSSPKLPLTFRAWTPDTPMLTDAYGIPYPAPAPDQDPSLTLIPDVLLIPVNAFDRQGYRIGYGSGYFDRTLATLRPTPLTIGIGFELARVACIAPESHDIPLDIIVTEAGTQLSRPPTHPMHPMHP